MKDSNEQDVLVMALFVVTRDSVLTCADELEISREEITEDVIGILKAKVNQVLGEWRDVVKNVVKDTIEQEIAEKKPGECPLGMTCTPSCPYKMVGECKLSREVR